MAIEFKYFINTKMFYIYQLLFIFIMIFSLSLNPFGIFY